MPPPVAALLVLTFIVAALRLDVRRQAVSMALWIPLIWMFLSGSRSATAWVNLGQPVQGIDIVEGSPLDRNVHLILMAGAAAVLVHRRFDWLRFWFKNNWILAFFVFSGISAAWSPHPLMSLRRLFRVVGNPLMALVTLTDRSSHRSMVVLLRRLALITLPLSILFIRWYPEYGRVYHMGTPLWTGIATHKNTLGQLCLLAGIQAAWSLLYDRNKTTAASSSNAPLDLLVLGMSVYLLSMIDSATSLACYVLAVVVLGLGRLGFVARQPRRILWVGLTLGVLLVSLEQSLDLKNQLIRSLDRDPTLTTRVPMWQDLLASASSPMLGSGFESYWTSDDAVGVFERWRTIQAHNGYLEMYLNLGIVGLALFAGGIFVGVYTIGQHLAVDRGAAILRLTWIATVLPYNWTEAAFRGSNNLWLLLLWAIIDQASVASRSDERRAVVPAETRRVGWKAGPPVAAAPRTVATFRR